MATEAVRRSLLRSCVDYSTGQSGTVPSTFKFACITPLLKNADLDPADAKSYRPISNLSVISKLLERLVIKQLLRYLKDNDLLLDLQSAYRAYHSTETAVLQVLSRVGKYHDIFENIKISQISKLSWYFFIFSILSIFSIFSRKTKILNKLYNNGCNTLMQYLMTISYQSFVPYVKTCFR